VYTGNSIASPDKQISLIYAKYYENRNERTMYT
jgi:hypothetical protein